MLFELHRSEFLRPRARLYELLTLQAAERGELLTDGPGEGVFDRRTRAGYLTDLESQGLLSRDRANGELRLTEAGRRRLHFLLVDYVGELSSLNESAQDILRRSLVRLSLDGVRRVAFYPHAETAEVAFSVLESLALELVAVVDDSPDKWDRPFHHLRVRPPQELERVRPEAVIVTTSLFEDRIVAKLKSLRLDGVRIHTL